MLLRLAIPLTVIVATSAYAMRPLPDHITSTNIIDIRGEWPERRAERIPGQINWRWPVKAPVSVTVKYGPPDAAWGPLICDKPWCKDGSGFGWWSEDVAGAYNKSWPEAQRRIEEARAR